MDRKKVAVGLSGGVDSAVALALLVEQGYEAAGVFLECWNAPGCRTDEDRKDALSVALKLKIPFKVLDFRKQYKKTVVDYFYDEYKAGRTPNPDVMCNKEIKFGLFYDWAMQQEFDYLATGHYAKVVHRTLCIPKDRHKDQTYFLYRLKQEQLGRILFPLGDMTKMEVRQEAKKRGLPVAEKPDSTGICFIGEVDVKELLKKRLGVKKGEVVDGQGRVLGEHEGVWFYTIGQRHGFRTSGGRPPVYVIEKDVKNNRLVVGFGPETYTSQFQVTDLNWLDDRWQMLDDREVLVRIRHGGSLIKSKIQHLGSKISVELEEPQRGVAPGQSAVFYQGDVVLGGGIID